MDLTTKHCLFCGPNEALTPLYERTFNDSDLTPDVFSARRETEHFHYKMAKCRNCGLVFSREILSDEELDRLYSKSTVTFSEHTDVLRRDYWRPLEQWAKDLPRGSALEIGCSSGFFLEELQDRGFKNVLGLEPSTDAKEKASSAVRDRIQTKFFEGRKNLGGERFDLVCLFQTIDHLTKPDEIIQSVREVLNPGGMVYLICHDVNALQAKILGEKSPIIDIEHVYLFNKQTLARLLKKAGLDVVATGDLKNSYPIDYWLHMLPMPRGLKNPIKALAQGTGLGRLSPSLRAGNIFAIGREPASVAAGASR